MDANSEKPAAWTAEAYLAIGLLSDCVHLIEETGTDDAEDADWAPKFIERLERLICSAVAEPSDPGMQSRWREMFRLVDVLRDEAVRHPGGPDALRRAAEQVTGFARVLRASYPAAGQRRGGEPSTD